MTSRERVLSALSHNEPDRLPVDFGATPVSGMHVSCIAALRDYFGLPKRLVQCHEPFQMLGILDEDLKGILGLDVEGVAPPATLFGFRNFGWKPWRMPDGLEILVPEEFRTTTGENGDILIYPEGDQGLRRAGACRRTAISSTQSSGRNRSGRRNSTLRTTWKSSSL